MGRPVHPEEVADAVTYLASSSASYINGNTLVVDGGASLQPTNQHFKHDGGYCLEAGSTQTHREDM